MIEKTKLHITFGQKYRREPHPTYPAAHPDMWVEVEGNTLGECYDLVGKHFGQFYAGSYIDTEWERDNHAMFYPRGCHEVIRAEEQA